MNIIEDKPIVIAQIMGKWVGGGVEAVIMNYYRHIDRSKIQFDFICDEDSTSIPYQEIEQLGGRVIICPPYQKIFKYEKFLIDLFKKNKYKIVHSNINTLSVFPLRAAKKAGVPIRIAHSHSTITKAKNKKEIKRNILKNILKHFSKVYANVFLACSKKAGEYQYGKSFYRTGKVKLINNAIEIEKFKYDETIREKKRKELEINKDTIIIGHLGRFCPTKNHSFIINVFDEIQKKYGDSKLLLAGEGPLIEEIQLQTKKLGLNDKIMFLGHRSDVNEIYQVFDVFILPSLYEGLPVVGVEAQASGVLCFFSNEITEEVKVIDSTIFMSLNDAPEKWANEILTRVKNFKRYDTSKRMLEKGFDINNEAKKLEDFYSSF